MAAIVGHLSVEALRERCVASGEARSARHFQTIWLLAKGHTVGEVAELTSFRRRWIEQLERVRRFSIREGFPTGPKNAILSS